MSGYLAEKICCRNYNLSSSGVDKSKAKSRIQFISVKLNIEADDLYFAVEKVVYSLLIRHKKLLVNLANRLKKSKKIPSNRMFLIIGVSPQYKGHSGLGSYILSTLLHEKVLHSTAG